MLFSPIARDNTPHVNTNLVSTLLGGLALLVGLALLHVTRPLVSWTTEKFKLIVDIADIRKINPDNVS